jgi:imidazolonepropionase-like amidohydrolase
MELGVQSEFLPYKFPARMTSEVAIVNVTLVPMDSNRTLQDQTVVIEGGKIKRIGPSASMPVGEGVTIVNGKGLFLTPGFSDMYTHYRDPSESPLYLAHGITTARTSGNPFQIGMERASALGAFPSPRMITVSHGIDGIGPNGRTDMPHGVPLLRPEDAAPLVDSLLRSGYRQIMPFSLLTKENLTALGNASADRGVRMVGNCPNAVSWEEAVAAGMSGFQQTHLIARDHMLAEFDGQTYWDRFDPAPGTKLDFEKIRRLGGFLAKHQAWNLPTIVFHQRASRPAEASMAHPSLKYVPKSSVADWETTIIRWGVRGRVNAEEWRALARIRVEAFHRVVKILHEEGAPQLTCTDGLNPYNVQGDTLLQEVENFASAGMSAFEALRCTTSEAARYMGEEDLWGTIAVGKYADMVLLRANPLQDIRAIRQVEATFVNGYYLSRAVLDDLLAQREQLALAAPPVPSTALPAATGEESVVDEGSWGEKICGLDFGRVSYRHTKLADGGWLIEERHAGANPRRHPERKDIRLTLDPDMNIRSGTYEVETFVGKETGEITWSDADGYTSKHVALDGTTSQDSLAGPARPPSEETAVSFVPKLILARGPSTIDTLDAVEFGAAEIKLMPGESAPGASTDVEWTADVSRLGKRGTQIYRLTADGKPSGVSETTVLLWPRELIPGAAGA